MHRWEYFHSLGNNCRLSGMTRDEAQVVVDAAAKYRNDGDDFWTGFMYGTDETIVTLPIDMNILL